MTRTTNARIAGFTYLAYIAVAYPSMVLFARATAATGARIAEHATELRVASVLGLAGCFAALVLAVTLYALTRDEDQDIAMLALTCRVGEGLTGAVSLTGGTQAGTQTIAATFFAVGSTLFCYLLLRGRIIPMPLAWIGFLASALVAVALPLQLAELLRGTVTQVMWVPVAVFEISVGAWWLIKGDTAPATRLRPEVTR